MMERRRSRGAVFVFAADCDGTGRIGAMVTKTQNYANHPHQPVLTGIGTAFLMLAIAGFALRWFLIGGRVTMAVGLIGLLGCNFVLLWISRVYTTKLQDRIIRLEMRVRAAGLLTPEQQRTLAGLPIKHVAALRFASDAELGDLCERAAREQLSADDIKKAVKNWVPDWDRT